MVSAGRRRLLIQGCLAAVATAMVVLATAASAAAPVIANGGFETGSLKGWKTKDTQAGAWSVYSGTVVGPPPTSKRGVIGTPVHKPPRGTYAVASTEGDPATTILYQDFTVPKHAELKLIAYYTSDAPMTTRADLDGDTDNPATEPNQQYRIDLIKPGASLRSVDPSDILKTVFRTKTGDPQKLKPTQLEVGLAKLAGEKVRLRVAQTDNQDVLAASVDGVKVKTSK